MVQLKRLCAVVDHADWAMFSKNGTDATTLCADYRSAVQQAFRHLGADLYLIAWLEGLGVEHDVLTDHALDADGAPLLDPYRVVVTGSHPEYVSEQMLDALEAFLTRGGRLMYLGANGFYWITSRTGHWIETRRGRGSTRTWASAPGRNTTRRQASRAACGVTAGGPRTAWSASA